MELGAEASRALALVGGLASSTVLSLFLVPSMFTLLARRSSPQLSEQPASGLAPVLEGGKWRAPSPK